MILGLPSPSLSRHSRASASARMPCIRRLCSAPCLRPAILVFRHWTLWRPSGVVRTFFRKETNKEIILMRNLNKLMLVTSLTAAAAMSGLTGCSTFQPKSSERTEGRIVDDKKIASTVKSELKNDPLYKFQDVDVKTFDGVVQLSGFVNSDEQKRRAEEIARGVPGVMEVQNSISLKPNNTYT